MRRWLWLILGLLLCGGAVNAQTNPEPFAEGLRDRGVLETWFASLSGDAHSGALWWSGQRSLRVHGSCSDPAMPVSGAWREGCLNARTRLDASDVNRHADADYRAGWNSYQIAGAPPVPSSPAPSSPASSSPASSSPGPPPALLRSASENCEAVRPSGGLPTGYMASQIMSRMIADCMSRKQLAQAELDRRKAEAERQARQVREDAARAAVLASETSPDNHCRDPEFAGLLIDEANSMRAKNDVLIKVIDIEHLVTNAWQADQEGFRCHGVFVLENGWRVSASISGRKNVAGRSIITWAPD